MYFFAKYIPSADHKLRLLISSQMRYIEPTWFQDSYTTYQIGKDAVSQLESRTPLPAVLADETKIYAEEKNSALKG